MEKNGRFLLQSESHSKQTSRGLCMLMERQCMVDIAICCGSNTLHAHKCILAAHSIYFKENLDNRAIEQVIINGVDFSVIKSIIEFIYCGECVVTEEHFKHFIAAVKLFKVGILEAILADNEYQNQTADEISIPNPQFICKPPKYPTVYKPYSNTSMPPKASYALSSFNQHKFKRKSFATEAEKACAKEAQASRIALANLRKVMATTPQIHSFVVEDSFNETTVENFIPTVEQTYENLNDVQFVSETPQAAQTPTNKLVSIQNRGPEAGLTADKIKRILGNDQVEIMFQTSDGNFVNVSDEVLLNLSKSGLQYQVVDENGHVGELQELKTLVTEAATSTTSAESAKKTAIYDFKSKNPDDIGKMADQNFGSSAEKDSLPLPAGFNHNLYENNFHMQNATIFEPENLSIRSEMIVDNDIEFGAVKYLAPTKLKPNNGIELGGDGIINTIALAEMSNAGGREETEDGGDTVLKSSLKFNADMFFADLSGSASENSQKSNLM